MNMLLASIILFVVGIYNRILIAGGGLAFYIHPRFNILSDMTSIVCLVVGAAGIIYYGRKFAKEVKFFNVADSEDPSQRSVLRRAYYVFTDYWEEFSAGFALLICFLLFAFLLTPQLLSPRSAAQRSSSTSSYINLGTRLSTFDSWFSQSQKYGIADWLKLLGSTPDLSQFVDREVEVVGFVFPYDQTDENRFLAARFVVQCCVVDASPVGLLVDFPEWKSKLKQQEWVNVKGKFVMVNESGVDKLLIKPDTVTVVPQPDIPYIF